MRAYLSSGGRSWPTGTRSSIRSARRGTPRVRFGFYPLAQGAFVPVASHPGRNPPHRRRRLQLPAHPWFVDDTARSLAARAGHSLPEAAGGAGVGVARTSMDQMEEAAAVARTLTSSWRYGTLGTHRYGRLKRSAMMPLRPMEQEIHLMESAGADHGRSQSRAVLRHPQLDASEAGPV